MRAPALVLLLAAALGAAGCSSSDDSRQGLRAQGRAIFRSAGCGHCHTLAAAGAHGHVGPDFDTSERLTRAQILQELNAGVGGMPSFRRRLSDRQEAALAEFLYRATRQR